MEERQATHLGASIDRRYVLQCPYWVCQCPRLRCSPHPDRHGSTEAKAKQSPKSMGYNSWVRRKTVLYNERTDHRGGTLEVEGGGESPHYPETQNLFHLFPWQIIQTGYIININNKQARCLCLSYYFSFPVSQPLLPLHKLRSLLTTQKWRSTESFHIPETKNKFLLFSWQTLTNWLH